LRKSAEYPYASRSPSARRYTAHVILGSGIGEGGSNGRYGEPGRRRYHSTISRVDATGGRIAELDTLVMSQ